MRLDRYSFAKRFRKRKRKKVNLDDEEEEEEAESYHTTKSRRVCNEDGDSNERRRCDDVDGDGRE